MKALDLTGKRFGRLVAVSVVNVLNSDRTRRCWECRCDCGNTVVLDTTRLRSGHTVSCGCFKTEMLTEWSLTHGDYGSIEYRSWANMKARCNNPNNDRFYDFGGRGIKVCARWDCFENFLADVGRRPSPRHQLGRLDVNRDYGPNNYAWMTPKRLASNRRLRRARHIKS